MREKKPTLQLMKYSIRILRVLLPNARRITSLTKTFVKLENNYKKKTSFEKKHFVDTKFCKETTNSIPVKRRAVMQSDSE